MKIIVAIWLALIVSVTINAQTIGTPATTGTPAQANLDDAKTMMAKIEKMQADLKKAGIPPEENKKEPVEKVLTAPQKVLILLPVFLFFLCLLITFFFHKRNGFDFRKSFYSEEPQQITIQTDPINNPKDTVTITLMQKVMVKDKEIEMPIYKLSVSRIIAFLSSLTTLSVIVCFISYYAYCMLKVQPMPDFKNLFEVIVGLGLGIVPYGFNKLTSTAKTTGL